MKNITLVTIVKILLLLFILVISYALYDKYVGFKSGILEFISYFLITAVVLELYRRLNKK